ncbi:unnamed protein product [Arabidopsis thaliana]|uniref:RRM domain-containing protein n=1 Tax=Arabidopsis thaliana TaxID=3702 RepID=A0A5S9XAL3_ARATH|nr:unnamed protein product [Arabidopsis thaliana]
MDEIANKGLEVKRSRKIRDSDIERISVTGYDIELPREHVESELKKLFSPCGEITDVHIPETRNSSLWSHAFIYFVGEGTADKALQLNGSDMGGWAVDAEADPFPKEEDNCVELEVEGYDTTLRLVDHVMIFDSFSIVYLVGEDAIDKAPKLSGTDMGGGRKAVVRFVAYHGRNIFHPRRQKGRIICGPPDEKPKMAAIMKIIKKPKRTAKKKIIKKPKMTLE